MPSTWTTSRQPSFGLHGFLAAIARNADVATLRYLCQQDGIAAHASNRDHSGLNILASCYAYPNVEITRLLLAHFPWLARDPRAVRTALLWLIMRALSHTPAAVDVTRLILQHALAPPPVLVDVDAFLAEAARAGWPDMCRMLIVDAHADARSVLAESSPGTLALKQYCRYHGPPPPRGLAEHDPDAEVLGAIRGCLEVEGGRCEGKGGGGFLVLGRRGALRRRKRGGSDGD